jgi:hypothetical protein
LKLGIRKRIKSLITSWKNREDYHGMYNTKIHNVWRGIRNRCDGNSSDECNKKYYLKGVRYCESWYYFKNFYNDMYPTYKKGYQIDRIDNSKGYSKDNCRWVTPKQNNNNKSSNVRFDFDGMNKTLSEWYDYFGVPYSLFRQRYYRMKKLGGFSFDYMVNKYNYTKQLSA